MTQIRPVNNELEKCYDFLGNLATTGDLDFRDYFLLGYYYSKHPSKGVSVIEKVQNIEYIIYS